MEGTVLSWVQTQDFASGKIVDDKDNWWAVTGRDVEPNSIGQIYLVEGEPVTFVPVMKTKKGSVKTYRAATNVKKFWKETAIDSRTHRELCLVKDGNWLVRQLGGLLTVNHGDLDGIKPGAVVACGVVSDGKYLTWRATEIRYVADSEEDVLNWDNPEEAYLNV